MEGELLAGAAVPAAAGAAQGDETTAVNAAAAAAPLVTSSLPEPTGPLGVDPSRAPAEPGAGQQQQQAETAAVEAQTALGQYQADFDRVLARLWSVDGDCRRAQQELQSLATARWRYVDARSQLPYGDSLLLSEMMLRNKSGKDSTGADLYIVREGGAQALTQSDAFVATQQEVRYLYRQQDSGRKLVQQHLAELRRLADSHMQDSRDVAALAASGTLWDVSTSPYGSTFAGAEWEQLLGHLAATAQQAPPGATVDLQLPGSSHTMSIRLADARQMRDTYLVAKAWPEGAPDWQQLPPFDDHTRCWLPHGKGGDGVRSLCISDLRTVLTSPKLRAQLPVVQLLYHAADLQRRPVWVMDLVTRAALEFRGYVARQATPSTTTTQQQRQQQQQQQQAVAAQMQQQQQQWLQQQAGLVQPSTAAAAAAAAAAALPGTAADLAGCLQAAHSLAALQVPSFGSLTALAMPAVQLQQNGPASGSHQALQQQPQAAMSAEVQQVPSKAEVAQQRLSHDAQVNQRLQQHHQLVLQLLEARQQRQQQQQLVCDELPHLGPCAGDFSMLQDGLLYPTSWQQQAVPAPWPVSDSQGGISADAWTSWAVQQHFPTEVDCGMQLAAVPGSPAAIGRRPRRAMRGKQQQQPGECGTTALDWQQQCGLPADLLPLLRVAGAGAAVHEAEKASPTGPCTPAYAEQQGMGAAAAAPGASADGAVAQMAIPAAAAGAGAAGAGVAKTVGQKRPALLSEGCAAEAFMQQRHHKQRVQVLQEHASESAASSPVTVHDEIWTGFLV